MGLGLGSNDGFLRFFQKGFDHHPQYKQLLRIEIEDILLDSSYYENSLLLKLSLL